MNKQELIAEIIKKAYISDEEAEKALQCVIGSISEAMKNGDKVQLVGFGSFNASNGVIKARKKNQNAIFRVRKSKATRNNSRIKLEYKRVPQRTQLIKKQSEVYKSIFDSEQRELTNAISMLKST